MADTDGTGHHHPIPAPTVLEGSVDEPLNREPPVEKLISSFITGDDAYDRNHGPIPLIDRATHRVWIDGRVARPGAWTIDELAAVPQHAVTAALQCAGNRRHTMRTRLREVDGIDWGDGAVMNCRWRGPRLRDVLLKAGVDTTSRHVAFACHQTATQDDTWYGASIELARALSVDAEVILALECNGRPLTPRRGAPVRVVVPGVAGARAVKWLDRITVQDTASANHYQQRDYKILPPTVENAEQAQAWWAAIPPLQDMPLNCVIVAPRAGATVTADAGAIDVRGYALPGGASGPIVRVEVSTDGRTWTDAALDGHQSKWSWARWHARVPVPKGPGCHVFARARDRSENEQPVAPAWNLRGVAYNGYGASDDIHVV